MPVIFFQSFVRAILRETFEMHLADALLNWINAKTATMEGPNGYENDYTCILKQVRTTLLPLWLAAEKRSCHFSKFADESINSIFRLLKIPSSSLISTIGDGNLHDLRIQLTKVSKRVKLSECPQITSQMILLSVLPSSHNFEATLRSIEQSPIKLDYIDRDQCSIILRSLPTLSFEAVREVDISSVRGFILTLLLSASAHHFHL